MKACERHEREASSGPSPQASSRTKRLHGRAIGIRRQRLRLWTNLSTSEDRSSSGRFGHRGDHKLWELPDNDEWDAEITEQSPTGCDRVMAPAGRTDRFPRMGRSFQHLDGSGIVNRQMASWMTVGGFRSSWRRSCLGGLRPKASTG